jgi:peptidoglycan hydrolase-like protein with peptidoglycan-binding domain
MVTRRLARGVLLLALSPIACSEPPQPEAHDVNQRLAGLDQDLLPGSRGEGVRALQEYLGQFGYFPNETLARSYPAWRPAVSHAPTPGVYDEATADAVKALQRNMGLAEVGIVNADTRALVNQARCGMPDNVPRLDPSDKFDAGTRRWPGPIVTWKITNPGPNTGAINWDNTPITVGQAVTAFAAGLATWTPRTGLTFQQITNGGSADITITFASTGGFSAVTTNGGATMTFNTGGGWSTSDTQKPNTADLQTVVMHEMGHSLGLNHSSFTSANMFPITPQVFRTLSIDDYVAVSVLYNRWQQLPGGAHDIGAGGVFPNSHVWITGTTPDANGDFGIYKFNGSGWTQSIGVGLRIATEADGHAWVVNKAGDIYRRTTSDPTTGTWQLMTFNSKAYDIGVGANGSVWIISRTLASGQDYKILKFDGSGHWNEPSDLGGAVRISVGNDGVPWVVNAGGAIYRRSADSLTGSWTLLQGSGRDIGANGSNTQNGLYAWKIGTQAGAGNGFDFDIATFNKQDACCASSLPPAQAKNGNWLTIPGGAVAISVDATGLPWVVNSAGAIFRAL